MRIHAIQTGRVQIKASQIVGRGHGLARRLAPLTDAEWSAWLPTFAYAIEHRDGVILVDSGASAGLMRLPRWHPYFRLCGALRHRAGGGGGASVAGDRNRPNGRQAGGADPHAHRSRRRAGGVPEKRILVSSGEIAIASGIAGRLRGYLPDRWPKTSIRSRSRSRASLTGLCPIAALTRTARSSRWRRQAIRATTSRSSSRTATRRSSSQAMRLTPKLPCRGHDRRRQPRRKRRIGDARRHPRLRRVAADDVPAGARSGRGDKARRTLQNTGFEDGRHGSGNAVGDRSRVAHGRTRFETMKSDSIQAKRRCATARSRAGAMTSVSAVEKDEPTPIRARIGVTAIFFANGFAIGAWAVAIPQVKALFGLSDGGSRWFCSMSASAQSPQCPWPGFCLANGRHGRTLRISGPVSPWSSPPCQSCARSSPGWHPRGLRFPVRRLQHTRRCADERARERRRARWGRPIMSSFHAAWSAAGWSGRRVGGLLISRGALRRHLNLASRGRFVS